MSEKADKSKKRHRGARGGNPWRASQAARFFRGDTPADSARPQLKGWGRRWQNQGLDRDRRIEKGLQNLWQLQALRRIEEMRYLEHLKDHLLECLSLALDVGFVFLIDRTFETVKIDM